MTTLRRCKQSGPAPCIISSSSNPSNIELRHILREILMGIIISHPLKTNIQAANELDWVGLNEAAKFTKIHHQHNGIYSPATSQQRQENNKWIGTLMANISVSVSFGVGQAVFAIGVNQLPRFLLQLATNPATKNLLQKSTNWLTYTNDGGDFSQSWQHHTQFVYRPSRIHRKPTHKHS